VVKDTHLHDLSLLSFDFFDLKAVFLVNLVHLRLVAVSLVEGFLKCLIKAIDLLTHNIELSMKLLRELKLSIDRS
jgi:hypothetical protein